MSSDDAIQQLIKLALREHLIVDGDCWFSCPLSGECCNEDEASQCNCGASEHNKAVLKLAEELGVKINEIATDNLDGMKKCCNDYGHPWVCDSKCLGV